MIFFYKASKSKKFFLWGVGGRGVGRGVDGRTDEQTQTNLPFNFFEIGA